MSPVFVAGVVKTAGVLAKLAHVFSQIGQMAQTALPYIAAGASLANKAVSNLDFPDNPSTSRSSFNAAPSGIEYSPSSLPHISAFKPIQSRLIPEYQSSRLSQDALHQAQKRKAKSKQSQGNLQKMQANTSRILNELAQVRGLPSYEQFHQEHGISYEPDSGDLGVQRFIQPANQPYELVQEDARQVNAALNHAPTQLRLQAIQADALVRQQEEAEAAYQWELAQKEHARKHASQLRQWTQVQKQPSKEGKTLTAQVSRRMYQGIELPLAFYEDPKTQEKLDLWKQLEQGNDLSDAQVRQLKLSIDTLRHSTQAPEELINAEVLEQYAKDQLIENKIEHLKSLSDDLWQYQGLALERIEAETAVELDTEHYWRHESHLTAQQLQQKLKEYAVGLWNFLYGDDITTLLDDEAHPLARVWAAAQLFPVMKVIKAGKLIKLVKFKPGQLPLSKLIPAKRVGDGALEWTRGQSRDSIQNLIRHANDHLADFGTSSAKEYSKLAWDFLKKPPSGTRIKIYPNQQRALYHEPSRTILITNKEGIPASFYKTDKTQFSRGKGTYTSVIRKRP